MANLGTLTTRHLHPHWHNLIPYPGDRGTLPTHHRTHLRRTPDTPPPYLADYAHYPVRMGDRAGPLYPHVTNDLAAPWPRAPAPLTNPNGRPIYTPHRIPLLWTVPAGAHSVTATVTHNCTTPPYPTLSIDPDPGAGVPALSAAAPATPNVTADITIDLAPIIPVTLTLWLSCLNHAPAITTTWGTISTT